MQTFDYVIVGAGTAGCLLANRLSSDHSCSVLLLEAGGKDNYHWIHIPVGYLYCIGNPRTDWLYTTAPDPGLNGRVLRYPRGRVLGGCSSINGMIYMRGQARDYDGWAALTGDPEWRWESCLPSFLAHEDHWRGASSLHAAPGFDPKGRRPGGEWRVEKQRLHWEILDAYAAAAVEAGIPATDDFNTGDNEGVGYFEVNQRSGWRWNANKGFLQPARARGANLAVWTGACVHKLEFGDRGGERICTGLEVQTPAGVVKVSARREVILSGGAIGTPVLLQRSGIGPADLLQRNGIPVVAPLVGVGANLQDHLQVRSVFAVHGARTLNTRANSLFGKVLIGLEYLATRSGPMSMAPSQLGIFTRSTPHKRWPDLQFHVQPLSLDAFGEPLHKFDALTASVCNLNPASRGFVAIKSPSPDDHPVIQPNYLSAQEDRQVAAHSLRVARRISAQPALSPYQLREVKPGAQYQGDDELAKLAGDIATTIFHPVGTCKMGAAHDETAVVDSRLRLRGVRNVRVVDASVMPTITSGNTNAPTLMIAEKAAAWIHAEHAARYSTG